MQWCREIYIDVAKQFGRNTATRTRNAFVEIVKEQNHPDVCAETAFAVEDLSSPKIKYVYVPYVQDEVPGRSPNIPWGAP